jgi:CarD family transcriptional regulator, regulator of rRNA transcription
VRGRQRASAVPTAWWSAIEKAQGHEVSSMKASAGTPAKRRGAAALHHPAPRRAAAPAKAGQATAAARKTASAKPAKQTEAKIAAKPAAKPAAPKPTLAKPAAAPSVTAARTVPVAKHRPPRAAAMPAEQPKPPPPAPPVAPRTIPSQPPADRRPVTPDRPPPRPPAKAEIFIEGDHVVYPTHGVGKVERIATEEIAGHKLELIHITFEENRMTLRVPVAKARSAGLRKLATRKLFDEALAVLKGRARIKRTMWSRRAQEYEAKINSGDPLAIAEVVRDLHRNAGQPDQSFSERQIYEAAMDRLAAELAALDKTDKLTAATKLTNFLKTM